MARRKRQLLDEDDSDSDSSQHSQDDVDDPDAQPSFQRKRRRPSPTFVASACKPSAHPSFVASSANPSSTPGLGFKPSQSSTSPSQSPPSSPPEPAAPSAPAPAAALPTSFGGLGSTARAFMRSGGVSSGSRPSTPTPVAALPVHEQAHLRKIGGTLGAQMLAKMGWTAGTGLGASGAGIVVPLETKLRPKNIGIAFRGFRERTDQSRLEARRRGEAVSDDETELTPEQRSKAREAREAKQRRAEAWKRPRKVKTKVEHKTYEEIVADAGELPAAAGLGQIIDATGPTPREVASLAQLSLASWTPSTDPMRIPEVRHNLRLMTETSKTDLDGLAREARALQERKRFVAQEDARLQKRVTDEAELISRLQKVTLVVDDVAELSSSHGPSLDDFSPLFVRLLAEFPTEFEKYRLDVVVVAAILPLVRRTLTGWDPLRDPCLLLSTFRAWKQALGFNRVDADQPMTPFESLLWHVWLPKVRTSINNEWDPEDPAPAVTLYETWSPFLPPFVRDNIFDQLILPKLGHAIADWRPKRPVALHSFVFPWLPHLGLRADAVLDDARRKIKALLRRWTPRDGVPRELARWRAVFAPREWDALLLAHVVPPLGASLRADLRVDPRAQDMAPLERVLAWSALLRTGVLARLLEREFFPKWLDALHVWLTQPRASLEEVAQWYAFWRGALAGRVGGDGDGDDEVRAAEGVVERGFGQGLEMMNAAVALGPDARAGLPRPVHPTAAEAPAVQHAAAGKPGRAAVRTHEVTFRAIVEEVAAEHDLLFVPAGRAHAASGMALFRVSRAAGRGGVLVYVLDDAVWAPDVSASGEGDGEGEGYRAITLEEMVRRASV